MRSSVRFSPSFRKNHLTAFYVDFVYTGQLKYDEPKTEDDEAKLLTSLLELLEVSEEWNMENLKMTVQSRILYDHEFLNQFPHAINTSMSLSSVS